MSGQPCVARIPRGATIIAAKSYRFKLQSVLDYRSDQLNAVQQRLAEEEQKRLRLAQHIREFDECIGQAFRNQQNLLDNLTLDPAALQSFPDYVWRLKQQRFQVFQALQAQERKLLQVREELKQALIKKKSLDILKDKDYAKYRKRVEKAEEEFMAELALNRLSRDKRA